MELKARNKSNKIAEFVEFDCQMREPIEDICRYANEKWKLRLSKTLMCDNTWKNNASNKPNMKRRIYANNYDEEIFKGEYYASLNDNESFDQSHGSRHSDSHREDHEDPQHEYNSDKNWHTSYRHGD